jgi:hypothetical protein
LPNHFEPGYRLAYLAEQGLFEIHDLIIRGKEEKPEVRKRKTEGRSSKTLRLRGEAKTALRAARPSDFSPCVL